MLIRLTRGIDPQHALENPAVLLGVVMSTELLVAGPASVRAQGPAKVNFAKDTGLESSDKGRKTTGPAGPFAGPKEHGPAESGLKN